MKILEFNLNQKQNYEFLLGFKHDLIFTIFLYSITSEEEE